MELFGIGKKILTHLPALRDTAVTTVTNSGELAQTTGRVEKELGLMAAKGQQSLAVTLVPRHKMWKLYDVLKKHDLNPDENHLLTYNIQGNVKSPTRDKPINQVAHKEIKTAVEENTNEIRDFLKGEELYTEPEWKPSTKSVKELKEFFYKLSAISPEIAKYTLARGLMSDCPIFVMSERGLSLPETGSISKENYTSIEIISEIFRALHEKVNKLNAKGKNQIAKRITAIANDFVCSADADDAGWKKIQDQHYRYGYRKERHGINSNIKTPNLKPKAFEQLREQVYRLCDEGTMVLDESENATSSSQKIQQQMHALPNGSQFDELFFKIVNTFAQGKEVPGFTNFLHAKSAIEAGQKAQKALPAM